MHSQVCTNFVHLNPYFWLQSIFCPHFWLIRLCASRQVGKCASRQVGKWASGQVGKWLVHGSHHFAQSQFAILSPRTPHSSRPCTLSLPSPLSNPFVTTFPAGHCRLCSAECRHSWVVDAFKHILKILRAAVVLKAYYPALCVGICCSV